MPRYLLQTGTTSGGHLDRAMRLVAQRYPEVVVEQRYTARDTDDHEVWACQAPSLAHVRRWAAAAQLDVRALHEVDTDELLKTRTEIASDTPDQESHNAHP